MKLLLNDKQLNKLDLLFDIDESNKVFADFILDVLYNSKNIAKKHQKDVFEDILNYFEVSNEVLSYFKPYNIKENITLLDVKEFEDNPYNKKILLNNVSDGIYKFKYEKYLPYECFLYKDITVNKSFLEQTSLAYFDKPYSYLTLSTNEGIWMLITPHEINTMKDAINNAFGKVITFGLGLGYFAYMCSIKENVSEVYIVEKDKTIISLFEKHILPLFEFKDKIHIINDDAIKYMDQLDDSFDYGFVDLWRDTTDGLPLYIKMYQKANKHQTMKVDYWIENSFLAIIKRCLISMLYDLINGYDSLYSNIENYYQHLINELNALLKDYIIKDYKDIEKLLSDEFIKQLILKVK